MIVKTNKVFVSAYSANKSVEANHENHRKAIQLLNDEGITFQIVHGFYKGSKELTLLLSSDNASDHKANLEAALGIGMLFNQESVLEVGNDNASILHNISGTADHIGVFSEVDSVEALASDNYTHEPRSNRYFVVR